MSITTVVAGPITRLDRHIASLQNGEVVSMSIDDYMNVCNYLNDFGEDDDVYRNFANLVSVVNKERTLGILITLDVFKSSLPLTPSSIVQS